MFVVYINDTVDEKTPRKCKFVYIFITLMFARNNDSILHVIRYTYQYLMISTSFANNLVAYKIQGGQFNMFTIYLFRCYNLKHTFQIKMIVWWDVSRPSSSSVVQTYG